MVCVYTTELFANSFKWRLHAPRVAHEAARLLEARLALLGADVAPTALYAHWTHTDPILERPFAGDQRLHADLHAAVAAWVASDLPRFDADHPDLRRLCPQVLIDLGRWCMPF